MFGLQRSKHGGGTSNLVGSWKWQMWSPASGYSFQVLKHSANIHSSPVACTGWCARADNRLSRIDTGPSRPKARERFFIYAGGDLRHKNQSGWRFSTSPLTPRQPRSYMDRVNKFGTFYWNLSKFDGFGLVWI
jgi:hypothetical protein